MSTSFSSGSYIAPAFVAKYLELLLRQRLFEINSLFAQFPALGKKRISFEQLLLYKSHVLALWGFEQQKLFEINPHFAR